MLLHGLVSKGGSKSILVINLRSHNFDNFHTWHHFSKKPRSNRDP